MTDPQAAALVLCVLAAICGVVLAIIWLRG